MDDNDDGSAAVNRAIFRFMAFNLLAVVGMCVFLTVKLVR